MKANELDEKRHAGRRAGDKDRELGRLRGADLCIVRKRRGGLFIRESFSSTIWESPSLRQRQICVYSAVCIQYSGPLERISPPCTVASAQWAYSVLC